MLVNSILRYKVTPHSINKSLNIVETVRKKLNLINDADVRESFKNLCEKTVSVNLNVKDRLADIPTVAQKVEMLEHPQTKKDILSVINKLCTEKNDKFNVLYAGKMQFVEGLADSSNILNEKYTNVKSNPVSYYRWLKRNNYWLADVIEGRLADCNHYRKHEYGRSKLISYPQYLNLFVNASNSNIKGTFEKSLRDEQFKKIACCYYCNPEYAPIIDRFYNNEYITKFGNNIRQILSDIKNEYNIMVVPTNASLCDTEYQYLKEELSLWKEYGNRKAVFPSIIDINATDNILGQTHSFGSTSYLYNRIRLSGLLFDYTDLNGDTLRHELGHYNDISYEHKYINWFEKIFRYFSWHINKFVYKYKWRKEMKNAGISNFDINYALTARQELKAISIEGDTSKYSESYKKMLVKKFKLQDWILNIPQNIYKVCVKSLIDTGN